MSTRWYRFYQKNNPQLRIFLPNFWMKLVSPQVPIPSNIVEFHCSIQMTKYDVQNYLEKIYNVKVKDVRTRIKLGKFKEAAHGSKYIIKDDDIKVVYAIMPKEESFVFPDLFKKQEQKDEDAQEKKAVDEMKENHKNFLQSNNKPGVPGWFGI